MKVYFVGAGPGDPELLTIKARKIIEKADVVIYAGSLVNKDILKFAGREALVYNSAAMTLDEVLSIFAKEKSTDKIIARIHSGDPSVYSAVQEQIGWCEKRKIDYEVIPGISSYQAAASALKQELTLPGSSQTIVLTRITGRTKVPDREDIEKLARARATMVIFLSVHKMEQVVKKLKRGYRLDTPVAVVEKASLPDERKLIGTLGDIAEKVEGAGMRRQAVIIVGDVLKKRYKRSKLYTKDFGHGFRKKTKL